MKVLKINQDLECFKALPNTKPVCIFFYNFWSGRAVNTAEEEDGRENKLTIDNAVCRAAKQF